MQQKLENLQIENTFLARAQELSNYGLVFNLTLNDYGESVITVKQITIADLNELDENGYLIVNALFNESLDDKFIYNINCESVSIIDFSKLNLQNVYMINNSLNSKSSEKCTNFMTSFLLEPEE